MRALAKTLALLCLSALALAVLATPAGAFGLKELDALFTKVGGGPATLAGSHPLSQTTTLAFDTAPDPDFEFEIPDGNLKDLNVSLPIGFVGNATAVPRCSNADFVLEQCPPNTQVGVIDATVASPTNVLEGLPVYFLRPGPGTVAKLGFIPIKVPVTIDLKVNPNPPYNLLASLHNTSNAIPIYGSVLTIFGEPPAATKPFLTLPRACQGPLATIFEGNSWEEPGLFTPPQQGATPFAASGCDELKFEPTIAAAQTSPFAESASGLDFDLQFDDEGLIEGGKRAQSDIEKAVVTLPAGVTTNPSIASGLASCSLGQYDAETLASEPGQGCPEASKVGAVTVTTPLLEQTLSGSIYIAKQNENPFNSLLALYIVIRDKDLGVIVKQAVKVDPNPLTGQLTTTVANIPQLPFSDFHLHFRQGPRAPLITPAACGTYAIDADLYPYANPSIPLHREATFTVNSAAAGGPCPPSLPHAPSFRAGTLSPLAGAYSPFVLKLSREDGSQQLSAISATLPEGLLGKLAGIPYCSEAQIAQAQARSAQGGGALELASPSCPAASQVGTVTVGAGAGPTPYFVTGKAYLAGPYKDGPLSLEIITPAIAGPFDLGVVAIRTALQVNESSAQITALSDPIPTILHGLPLDVRQIAVNMDRPSFTFNPTSCEPKSIAATATSTLSQIAPLSAYFQASGCGKLAFKPKLSLSLKGATKRNQNPALNSVLTYPKGAYANIARAVVTLPPAEFIDNEHINNPCTRVQFAAHACPPKSVLGSAVAKSPLLDKPLKGPVYFRSNGGEHLLPDIVADLNGQIHVILVGNVDSVKAGDGNTRIRTTFARVPDAPVSKFTLSLYGGKKGLLVNSQNICKSPQKAKVSFTAQNAKRQSSTPLVENDCGKGAKRGR